MKQQTFQSCGLIWYPWPADGQCPCEPDQHIRLLTKYEFGGASEYNADFVILGSKTDWSSQGDAGWYPVNPDGTEIKKPARPRVIRRRSKLKTR